MSTLNELQEQFVNVVCTLADDGKHYAITVTGAAGTGKTYTVLEMKRRLAAAGKSVVTVAPTNSAAKIAGGVTIHKYFEMRPIDPDLPSVEFGDQLKFSEEGLPDVLFVDEVSMVTDRILSSIQDLCRCYNVLLVCVGDQYQLPPVGQDTTSIAFSAEQGFSVLTLDQVVRQKNGSSIIALAADYRQYRYSPNLTNTATSNDVKNICQGNMWTRYWDERTTVVGYSNKAVIAANTRLSAEMRSGPLFAAGDSIVLKHPVWYKTGEYFDKEAGEIKAAFGQITTGDEVVLRNTTPSTVWVKGPKGDDHVLSGTYVEFNALDDDKKITKFLLDYKDYAVLVQLKRQWVGEQKKHKSTSGAELMKARWLRSGVSQVMTAYHRYASTVHLSQGKSHEKTMLMSDSFYYPMANNDISLYNRLAYVAITRPKERLFITRFIK